MHHLHIYIQPSSTLYMLLHFFCRLYGLALDAGTIIDKQYNVIIVSVYVCRRNERDLP